MKRVLIGCFMALLGSLWGGGIIYAASHMLVTSWDPDVGRLMTTILERGIILPFAVSVLFVVLGVIIMAVEFFKKED